MKIPLPKASSSSISPIQATMNKLGSAYTYTYTSAKLLLKHFKVVNKECKSYSYFTTAGIPLNSIQHRQSTEHRNDRYINAYRSDPTLADSSFTCQQCGYKLSPYAIIALLLSTLAVWYGSEVYKYWGFPYELMKLLNDAEQCTNNAGTATSESLRIMNLKEAENKLRAAVKYLDDRLPPNERSNLHTLTRRTSTSPTASSSASAKSGSSTNHYTATQWKSAIDNAPIQNKNYVHPSLLPHTLCKLAQNLQSQSLNDNQLNDSEAAYLRTIQIYSQQYGLFSPQTISPTQQLGWLYYDRGMYDNAKGVLLRALEIITHIRKYHDPNGQITGITDKDGKSTIRAIQDYLSISRMMNAVSQKYNDKKSTNANTSPVVTPNQRLQELFNSDVESEISEQLGRVFRAQKKRDLSLQWTINSLKLLLDQLPRMYTSYITVTDTNNTTVPLSNKDIIADSQSNIPLDHRNLHRLKRCIDILSGISSDLHYASQHELANKASLASLNVLALISTLYMNNTLPPMPSIDTILPQIFSMKKQSENDKISTTTNKALHLQSDMLLSKSPTELHDYLDYVALNIIEASNATMNNKKDKNAEHFNLDLIEEAVASFCNASTTLFSVDQNDAAKHAVKLARKIADIGNYNPPQLIAIEKSTQQYR